MKNIFAIALGIADGLQEKTGVPHHNLKAATLSRPALGAHPPSSRRVARAHRGVSDSWVGSAMTDKLGVADPTDGQ